MDFAKAVIRDNLIYTLPFIIARFLLYPIIHINGKMQRNYLKIEEEADAKEHYQKYHNFSLKEKIQCARDIVRLAGVRGLYEKVENYVIPFTIARWNEGLVYFIFMRFCVHVLKLEDPLFLLSGLSFFLVSLMGAFSLKYFSDVVRERKSLKAAVQLLSPSNLNFWKQYEIELGCYHVYSLIQGYFQIITFHYLKPKFGMEIALFALSRIVAAVNCQPLNILVQWAGENNFDHGKLFSRIIKKEGSLGLYAGARDLIFNEIIISVLLIPGFHIFSSIL